MHCTVKMTEDLYWVGASDRRLALFEGVFGVPRAPQKTQRPAGTERCAYVQLAFLAMSHRAVNATASLMAISDSILRLISTPASFRPCMKVE